MTTRRRLRLAWKLGGYLTMVALVAGWWTYLRPEAFGGSTSFVLVSGQSMEPTYHTGDLVIVRKQARYDVGDVVAFRTEEGEQGGGLLVIHRVIDVLPDGRLVLQGDNNDFADPWNPTADQVAGARFVELRGWGRTYQVLVGSPILLGAVFGGLVTTLVMLGKPTDGGRIDGPSPAASPLEPEVEVPARRRYSRLFACWLAVGVIATVANPSSGSASRLELDGGVVQSFAPPLPGPPAEPDAVPAADGEPADAAPPAPGP